MARGKSGASEKQKVSECSGTNSTQNTEEGEDPPIGNEKQEEEADGQKQEQDGCIRKDDTEKQENGDEENADKKPAVATPTSDEEVTPTSDKDDEEASEVWDIIRVIPTAEEKIKCRYENCTEQAVATWASDKNPEDKWPLCEKCQLEDFGGWPTDVEPIEQSDDITVAVESTIVRSDDAPTIDVPVTPIPMAKNEKTTTSTTTSMVNVSTDSMDMDHPENEKQVDVSPSSPVPEPSVNNDEREPEASEEKYELSRIISLEKILGNPIKCNDENCNLPACSIWTSTTDPKKWYYCIDCQERDFDGWPPSNELPCDYLEPEHLKAIATKCSKKKKPVMPTFVSHCVTPLPNSPRPPNAVTATSQVVGGQKKTSVPKVSRAALARHEMWQADAKKLGVNRIIVKKNEAQKVVFDTLHDAFCPMNFNNIYTVSLVSFQRQGMQSNGFLNTLLIFIHVTLSSCRIINADAEEKNSSSRFESGT